MDHINTTHTAVQKLKHEAKQRSKASSRQLNSALEEVARESGYSSWKHVISCLTAPQGAVGKVDQQQLPLRGTAVDAASAAGDSQRPSRGHPFIAELEVRRLQAGIYEYRASYRGTELYADAGFSSIEDALRSASGDVGDIRGFEVCYGGVVVGTYLAEDLYASASTVAAHAVWIVNTLGD